MKSIVAIALAALVFTSCARKVDEVKAKKLTSDLLEDTKKENYNNMDKYYTSSFNESEPLEKKIEKYNRLKDVMGPIISWELTSSKQSYDSDRGINQLELKYKVKCQRLTVDETFLVVNDEGDEKIIFHNIENEKDHRP
jgi:hypothetical protein